MEEAHPIPQNVTAFQFHLIGDMTIRQFIYLATGLVIGYFTFLIVYPRLPLIAAPIILISVLLGVAFAFLPILDRPLDHWVKAYFKAVYSATQGRWKSPVYPPDESLFTNRLNIYLSHLHSLASQENSLIYTMNKPAAEPTIAPPPPVISSAPNPTPTQTDNSNNLRSLKPAPLPISSTPSPLPTPTDIPEANQKPGLDFNPTHNQPLSKMQLNFNQPEPDAKTQAFNTIPTGPVYFPWEKMQSTPPPTQTVPAVKPQPDLPVEQSELLNKSANAMKELAALPFNPQDMNGTQDNLPSSDDLNKLVEMAKQARTLQLKLSEAEKQINALTTTAPISGIAPEEHKNQFQQIFTNLQTLIQQADLITQQATTANKSLNKKKKEVVKVVEPPKPQASQVLLTSQPNVINGIVRDQKGTYLDNVIIIIHDKDQLPVRALKTNKIGQFTGTTPLPNGVYTITLEKDGLEFDTLQVTLNGEVMPPLDVTAKGAKAA